MTTPTPGQEQLERIRKLLSTADSFFAQSKEPDDGPYKTGESYQSKAFELAARYEIDLAIARQRKGAEREIVINTIFYLARPYAQQLTLAYVIYSTFGCELVDISTSRSKSRKYGVTAHPGRAHAFGFKGDMDRASMLLTSLSLQAQRESVKRYRQYLADFEPWSCPECGSTEWRPIPRDDDWYYCVECEDQFYSEKPPATTPDRRSVWYRSFWNGWVSALRPRIEAAHKSVKDVAVASVGTSAVVALRSRDLAVQEEFGKSYPKTTTRHARGSKGSGYEAGREAGRNADIGSGKLGATRREVER